MGPLLFFLGGIVSVFLILGVICLVIYNKFKSFSKSIGYSDMSEIKNMIMEGEKDAKYRQKSITGLSNILIPKIVKDYPSFNEAELYNKVETSLKAIFESLESKKVSDCKELALIRDLIDETIKDLKGENRSLVYDDVVFHKHAIKEYNKEKGYLSITVATSLEYYYEEKVNNKVKVKRNDYKTQTAYITKYIYIYDPTEYVKGKSHLSAHCPNCGAPLKNFKDNHCDYCGAGVEAINLKSWFISSYKEKK